jgi:hypothetical protein
MPAKSRRGRRNISTRRKNRTGTREDISVLDKESTGIELTQIAKQSNLNNKSSATPIVIESNLSNELKWIGITTGIIAILLVIAYIFLR